MFSLDDEATLAVKGTLALGIYWALFIIAPLALCIYVLHAYGISGWFSAPVFFILLLLGEHGFGRWKRLWRP